VFSILDKDSGTALDADCIAALKSRYGDLELMPSSGPAVFVSVRAAPAPPSPAEDDQLRPLRAA